VRPSYATAVLGPTTPQFEGIFDDIAHAVTKTVKDVVNTADKVYVAATPRWVRKAAGDAVSLVRNTANAIDDAYVAYTPDWLRKISALPFAQTKFIWDTAQGIAHGERIDRVLLDAAKKQVGMYRAALPLAQLGVGFVPGLGHGVNAAIGAGLALADGKPITEAMIEAVKSAIPGGPLVKAALDVGMRGAVDLAQGKRLDTIALDAVRNHLPGGEAAKIAFDTGLALAQGKKIQDAGLAAVGRFVPNNPLAQGAFEMTKRAMAGKPLEGSTRAAMKTMGAHHVAPPARPVARKHAPPPVRSRPIQHRFAPAGRIQSVAVHAPAPLKTSEDSSSAVPIMVGIAALAAAGGGAWWWTQHHQRKRPR
jgi:hypothetical protein